MRGFLRAAACGLLGTVLVAAADVSRAVAEDAEPSFDRKIINNVLNGLGLRSGAGDIDYRERSPLVLPPKINLPPPQANAAAGTPGWPVDPDVKRRKEESNRRRDEVEESRPLRPNELNVGERTQGRSPVSADHPDGRPMGPAELGYRGGLFGSLFGGKKEEAAQFTEEPPRTTLTEPPIGYQTPSPSQPYTAKPDRWLPKVPSFFDFGTAQQ